MRETMYASWLASGIAAPERITYTESGSAFTQVFEEFFNGRGVSKDGLSPADFFAEEMARSGPRRGRKDMMRLLYDKKNSVLEFVRILTAESIRQALESAAVLASAASFREEAEPDICAVSMGDAENLSCFIEIGRREIKIKGESDGKKSLPEHLDELYLRALEEYSAESGKQLAGQVEPEVAAKFASIVGKRLENGAADAVLSATPEEPNILTEDALYLTDGKNVLNLYGSVINGADPFTFVSLGNYYAKDANRVYYGSDMMEGADAKTFAVIPWEYARDAERGYFKGIPICGGRNFRALGPAYGYATDGETVYYCGAPVEGCNPAAFYSVGDGRENDGVYFGSDGKNVYFEGKRIDYIDAASFEHIEKRFFKDRSNVYWGPEIIDGCVPKGIKVFSDCYIADPYNVFFVKNGCVTVLPETDPAEIKVRGLFAADKKSVYYKGCVIEGADGATADISDRYGDGYVTDAFSVFFCGKKIPASPKTFEPLGFGYARDGNTIFFRDRQIKNADASSFMPEGYGSASDRFAKYSFDEQYSKKYIEDMEHVTGGYFKDRKNVYYESRIIEGADIETFSPVPEEETEIKTAGAESVIDTISSEEEKRSSGGRNDYAKDAKRVYFMGKPADGADPETFILLRGGEALGHGGGLLYGRDSSGVYFRGRKIEAADPATFCAHDIRNVWKDKNFLFKNGETIPYIDAPSFTRLEYSFYKDINGIYLETEKIEGIFPENVMVLGDRYIKDDVLFCYAEKTEDGFTVNLFEADANSFDIVETEPSFSLDRNGMFFRGLSVENLDMGTAELLGGDYLKDKSSVFCGSVRIPEANSASFVFLGDGYATDGNECYYGDIPLGSQKATHLLGNGYATDGYIFWRKGIPVKEPENDEYISEALGGLF